MGNLLKYSGIVTKIRAMEAKLLTPEQFADIANLRSVPDIADYLRKNTAYAEVLDTFNGRSDPSRKHREGACAVALSRLHKDLPFLRAESERIYEADHERIRDRADQLLSAYRDQPL